MGGRTTLALAAVVVFAVAAWQPLFVPPLAHREPGAVVPNRALADIVRSDNRFAQLPPLSTAVAVAGVLFAAVRRHGSPKSDAVAMTRRGSCALAATADGEAKVEEEAEDAEAKPEAEEAPKRPKRVFDPTKQVGVTAPLGYFDPLGFCKMGDRDGFRNYRVAELKHGRVAMLASGGLLLQHFYHPFIFDNLSPGIWAATETPAKEGLFMLFLTAGAVEVFVWTEDPYKEPGNYGDPLGVNIYDLDMRNRELNNGRLAMFATIGQIAVQLYTGLDGIEAIGGPSADQFGDF